MLPPRPPDFPPLLPLGFHPKTLDEIDKLCVAGFPLSKSRKPIMEGLRQFVQKLNDAEVEGDLWLDGSFLSQKIDPKDVDIVLRLSGEFYDAAEPVVRDAVDWVVTNQKSTLLCDSYTLFEYQTTHPLHDEGKWWYSYWHVKWGFSRQEVPKGIAVVPLTGKNS